MLTSLFRILFFLACIAAVVFGVTFLLDTGDEVRLSFGGQEYIFEPLPALIFCVILFAAIWLFFCLLTLLFAVFRFFNGDETAFSRYFTRNRERKGYEALGDGMVALAAGEGRLALTKAARAERYLENPELTNLINAQAAEIADDTKRAQKYYKSLLESDRTRFVGVQGLMRQKLTEGDADTALKLAEKAFALRPRHGSTLETLFRLQTDKGDWTNARQTVAAKVRANILPRDVGKRREAVLALEDARALLDGGDFPAGKEAALYANRTSPDLIPAARLAAEMQILDGKKKAAAKILKKTWASRPHPDLAATFAEIEPEETPQARVSRFSRLIRQNPEHMESRLLNAKLMLTAEDFPAARRALGKMAEETPTSRSLAIMAAIEKGEGADDAVVRTWLAKALNASRGPRWICEKCSGLQGVWTAKCGNCAAFDALEWRNPPAGAESDDGPAALPIMAGVVAADATDAATPGKVPESAAPRQEYQKTHTMIR
ncbi:MAG: heme biosynthesis protein HemY [Rhodobacteraceae bacterium]|nr:heme biosynthesis protein HemY [Paracoccaceae bacterium]